MAFSRKIYTATSAQASSKQFDVTFADETGSAATGGKPYISATHIKAKVNGVVSADFTVNHTASPSTLTFGASTTISENDIVEVYRETPRDLVARTVDFTKGALLTEGDLDLSAIHNQFMSQEAMSGDVSVVTEGATTERDLAERFADVKNVRDFGAVGDGSTDDRAAIQLALDAARDTGYVVFFPPGRYKIDCTSDGLKTWGCTLMGSGTGPRNNPNAAANLGLGSTGTYASTDTDSTSQIDVWVDESNTGNNATIANFYSGGTGMYPEEIGYPAIRMGSSTTISGLTFFYPQQDPEGAYSGDPGTATAPRAFAPTIRHYHRTPNGNQNQAAGNCVVENCLFVNPYWAIDCDSNPNTNMPGSSSADYWNVGFTRYINNWMAPIFIGVSLQETFAEMLFTGNIVTYGMWKKTAPSAATGIRGWTNNNGYGLVFGQGNPDLNYPAGAKDDPSGSGKYNAEPDSGQSLKGGFDIDNNFFYGFATTIDVTSDWPISWVSNNGFDGTRRAIDIHHGGTISILSANTFFSASQFNTNTGNSTNDEGVAIRYRETDTLKGTSSVRCHCVGNNFGGAACNHIDIETADIGGTGVADSHLTVIFNSNHFANPGRYDDTEGNGHQTQDYHSIRLKNGSADGTLTARIIGNSFKNNAHKATTSAQFIYLEKCNSVAVDGNSFNYARECVRAKNCSGLQIKNNQSLNSKGRIQSSDPTQQTRDLYLDSGNTEVSISGNGWSSDSDQESVASEAELPLPQSTLSNALTVTGTSDITSIAKGSTSGTWKGREVVLAFSGTAATNGVQHGSNIRLRGQADFAYRANDTLHLVCANDNGDWDEVSRSRDIHEFNVKDYGAAGDGTTDDTSAIQAAVDAVEANGGGLVFFPKGDYLVSDTITVDSSFVSLEGAGMWNTTLKRAGDYGDTLYFTGLEASGTRLYDVGVSKLRFESTGTTTSGAHIHMSGVTRATIDQIRMLQGNIGFHFEGLTASYVSQVYLVFTNNFLGDTDNRRYMLCTSNDDYSHPDCGDLFVSDFNLRGNQTALASGNVAEHGLEIRSADGIWFSNGHIGNANKSDILLNANQVESIALVFFNSVMCDACGDYGVWFINNTTPAHDISFTGCHIKGGGEGDEGGGAQHKGVYVSTDADFKSIQFSNCVVRQWDEQGIYINSDDAENWLFADCQVRGNSNEANGNGTTNTHAGIEIANGDKIQVLGGQSGGGNYDPNVGSDQKYGVKVGASATNVTLSNLDLRDNETAGYDIDEAARPTTYLTGVLTDSGLVSSQDTSDWLSADQMGTVNDNSEGTTIRGQHGGASSIRMHNATGSGASVLVPTIADWPDGKLKTVRLYLGAGTGSATYDLSTNIGTYATGTAINTGEYTTQQSITSPSSVANSVFTHDIPVDLSFTASDMVKVSFGRVQSETVTDNLHLLGILLIYQAS